MNIYNKKLGYYDCNGTEFYSKIQACFHAVKVGKPVGWNFNDDVFSKIDWTQEPEETLDQLYDQRARQLREKYNYIVLSYSGGSDSHNIYESFRRQGLHIDEIVVNTLTKASEKFVIVDPNNKEARNGPEAEHQLQLIPRLKEIHNAMPRTKISVHDMSDILFSSLAEKKNEDWILDMKEGVNPVGITRHNYLKFKNVRSLFDIGHSTAIITGIEKPRTFIAKGNLYFRFIDRSANINAMSEHFTEYDNCTLEYFYWSPDCARMLVKQGHVIKKFLEAMPENQHLWLQSRLNTSNMFRLVHERILRSVIYTTWNNDWYQADKAVGDWYSEFDRWFIDNYKETVAWRAWNDGITLLKTNLTPFLKNNLSGIPDGLLPIVKNYNLGPIKLKDGLNSYFIQEYI